jgi:putative membrane protein
MDAYDSRVYSERVKKLKGVSMSATNFRLCAVATLILTSAMYAQAPQQNVPATSPQNTGPQNNPSRPPQNSPAQNPSSQNPMPTSAQTPAAKNNASFSDFDKKFIQKAATDGIGEVQLGQLALQKASSEDIKKFAQRMVDDHTKANQQLQQIASASGVSIPQQPSAGVESAKQQLSAASGQAFDQFYMALMLQDHDNALSEFTREKLVGQNTNLKNFVDSTLPVLQDHLNTVRGIINAQNAPARSSAQPTQPTATTP